MMNNCCLHLREVLFFRSRQEKQRAAEIQKLLKNVAQKNHGAALNR